ncbi:MAG: TIGR03621 family F420-dependent LLM class oxidoreductase [Chloroflexota bacterium]
MPEKRPFTFAAMMRGEDSGSAFIERARRIESMGYSTAAMVDHFNQTFAPVPALTAAAIAAPSLRVLATVFDNDFRNPVLLAKEMVTIDRLTDGRVDVGIGAGWMESDYRQTGIQYDPPGVRISRMEEALTVMKGFWRGELFDYNGEHYTIEGLRGYPLPVQQPHPPVYIGGGGKRILGIAGREADIIGVHVRFGPDGQLDTIDTVREEMDKKFDWIRDGAGDRFDQIQFALMLFAASIVDSESAKRDEIAAISERIGQPGEAVAASPYYLVGSERELIEQIEALRETWNITHFTIPTAAVDSFAPVVKELVGK